jgi:D-cysteine desulfhydrase family pyridoxal phosphate-dependent enzyme
MAGRMASAMARSSTRVASARAASVAATREDSASGIVRDGSVPLIEPRIPLAHLPTPLEPMDRLGEHLGMAPGALLVKRDDATGLAGGGNKARKLEYLCADALAQGCDVLVTGGGRQSNHVRMTAAAANKLGLACTVVLAGGRPGRSSGNVVLDELLRPEIVWVDDTGYYATEEAIGREAARLASEGRRPYLVPIGGASTVGALGYVAAAAELVAQAGGDGVDVVVVADGSGGTHAGLVAGLGDHDHVLGVDVGTRPDLDEQVPKKAAEVAALAGLEAPRGRCRIDHERYGAGYGDATPACREALDLAARFEGLILDPVYTGKAMAGLIAARRDGRIGPGTRTVFLHTGGMPALFASAYAEWIRGEG